MHHVLVISQYGTEPVFCNSKSLIYCQKKENLNLLRCRLYLRICMVIIWHHRAVKWHILGHMVNKISVLAWEMPKEPLKSCTRLTPDNFFKSDLLWLYTNSTFRTKNITGSVRRKLLWSIDTFLAPQKCGNLCWNIQ